MTNKKPLEIDQFLEDVEIEPKNKKANFHDTHAPITVWVPLKTEEKYREAQERGDNASKVLKEIIVKVVDKTC